MNAKWILLPLLTGFSIALAGASGLMADVDLLKFDRLIEAANTNDVARAEGLLNRGHFPDAVDGQQRTALIIAAARGYEDLADVLVRSRASVDAADTFGNTALFYAARGDHIGIIEILIEGKADVNVKNRQGMTPLIAAAAAGRLAAVQTLLDLKANAAETDFTGRTARDWAKANSRRQVLRIFDRYGIAH